MRYTRTERAWARLIMAAVVFLVVGTLTFAVVAWIAIDNAKFERYPVVDASAVETSRYFDSGDYAPFDLDGDGVADEWIRGDYVEGDIVQVRQGDSVLLVSPGTVDKVFFGVLMGIFLVLFVIIFFVAGVLDLLEEIFERRTRRNLRALSPKG